MNVYENLIVIFKRSSLLYEEKIGKCNFTEYKTFLAFCYERDHLLCIQIWSWQISFCNFFSPFQNYGRLICFENVTMCHKRVTLCHICVTNILLLKFVSSKTKWLKYSWKSHVTNLWSKFQTYFSLKNRELVSKRKVRCHFEIFSANCFHIIANFCLSTVSSLLQLIFLRKKSFRRCTMIQQKACIWMCGCNVILHIVLTCEKR